MVTPIRFLILYQISHVLCDFLKPMRFLKAWRSYMLSDFWMPVNDFWICHKKITK